MNFFKIPLIVVSMALFASCASTSGKKEVVTKRDIQEKGVLYPKIIPNELLASLKQSEKIFALTYSQEGNLVLLPADDPSLSAASFQNDNYKSIISEPLTDDLSVIYVLDGGSFATPIVASAHLKEFNLSIEQIKTFAIDNINEYALSPKTSAMSVKGTGIVTYKSDGKYESSLLLADKFIESLKSKVKGDLVFYIPVSNVFSYVDTANEMAPYEAKGFIKGIRKHLPNPLSAYGFMVLSSGKLVEVE